MVSRRVISGVVLLSVLAAAPVFAPGRSAPPQRAGDRRQRSVARVREPGARFRVRKGAVRSDQRAARTGAAGTGAAPVQQAQAPSAAASRRPARPGAASISGQQRPQYRRRPELRLAARTTRYGASIRRLYHQSVLECGTHAPDANKGYGYGYGSRTVIVPRYITPRFMTGRAVSAVRVSPQHRARRLLRHRRVLSLRLHAARLLRSDRRPGRMAAFVLPASRSWRRSSPTVTTSGSWTTSTGCSNTSILKLVPTRSRSGSRGSSRSRST